MTPVRSGRVRARPEISIIVDAPEWRKDRGLIQIVRRAGQLAAQTPRSRGAARIEGPSASVLLSSDKTIQELNDSFRGKNEPTNVLAFPALPQAAPYIGDVALAYGVIRRRIGRARKKPGGPFGPSDHPRHFTFTGL